ncbi:MAG: imelysin family protein [Bacteroidota bacterium]
MVVMKNWRIALWCGTIVLCLGLLVNCSSDNNSTETTDDDDPVGTTDDDPVDGTDDDPMDGENGFVTLLTNQIDEVIIPTMANYQEQTEALLNAANTFVETRNEANLTALRVAYQEAYLAYQAAGVHDYFITSNLGLVDTSNLFPVDLAQLDTFIEDEAYSFNASSQERASGYPALDYMLFGPDNVIDYFNADEKRGAFMAALVLFLKEKADLLVQEWSETDLRTAFINSSGTGAGSSISSQLNKTMVYYEIHVRENKVGIPIGRVGPNDSPIDPDPTKIEGYYQSLVDGNDSFALSLVQVAIEEMEDLYLGSTSDGSDGQGYDDLVIAAEQASIDTELKAQFQSIYDELDGRTSISGNSDLYDKVQGIVTVFKSDLFPVLNVEDTDMLNDGD